ncbi:MAG TPA: tetratricopeptide repeat protein, partial [Afifellaceae bacterium]|nr:tetratricopeptide repeat protein [Afifellaceae bacterium]
MAAIVSPPAKSRDRLAENVFAIPARHAETLALEELVRNGEHERAELLLRQRLGERPDSAVLRYMLAAALAAQGRTDAALDSLEQAVASGLARPDARLQVSFSGLPGDPRYEGLLARLAGRPEAGDGDMGRPTPSTVEDRTASVEAANTRWDPERNVLLSAFRFPADAAISPLVQAFDDRPARRLNSLFAAGMASGNTGDLYDNRDNGHSSLRRDDFPQLTYVEYGEAARAAGIQAGVNPGLLFDAVTIGNSSMAVTSGPFWRSQPRLALTRPGGAAQFFAEYAASHLYVFPEHRDYDPGHGDVFPANTPYLLISQGSSGSDRPLLRAVAAILAAFRPEVKDFLRSHGLVMPTVQMIFRRGRNSLTSDGAYLSGAAHPAVFDAGSINLAEMIARANQLRPEDVPPMVHLSVMEETRPRPGVDLFGPVTEILFDTPGALARTIRATGYEHRMTVSATDTVDPNGRALKFHWVVLSGDARRIRIAPKDESRTVVDITVPWHEPRPVPGRPDITMSRVDIGVFADNGVNFSAPAFISLDYPANQWREYDADGRVLMIDYHGSRHADRYVDPVLYPLMDWKDRYRYDAAGNLTGWTRERPSGESRFTRDGGRVIEEDQYGRPLRAAEIRYDLQSAGAGLRRIVERPTGRVMVYGYSDIDDTLGKIIRV